MVEKDELIKEKVSHTGLGDFKAAYKHAHSWLKEDKGYNLIEEKYSEKIEGDSRAIEVEWTASKEITDYFKVVIKVKWKIEGMVDVEVEIDGRKKQMNKYKKLEIEIKGILEKDYKGNWNSNQTQNFFKEVYHKYIIPERINKKEEECIKTVQDFKEEMKALFELTAKR